MTALRSSRWVAAALVLSLVASLGVVVAGGYETSTGAATVTRVPTGYWEVAADGGIFTFGSAPFYGSMGGKPLNAPIVGMALDPASGGYWLVASDGGVFSFNAPFYGSMGGRPLSQPIVGMAATPTGRGYWEVAADGGVFSFGSARFYGSLPSIGVSTSQAVGIMAATATRGGYWIATATGTVWAFPAGRGVFSASHTGSQGGTPVVAACDGWVVSATAKLTSASNPDGPGPISGLVAPVVGCAAVGTTAMWVVGADGGIFTFGSAPFYGSMGGKPLNAPIVGMALP